MFLPQPLPRTLFEEIGKIIVIWATIEQDLVLQTSAMAAIKTDGKPTDYLRLDFTRLRRLWFGHCRANFSDKWFNKIVNPLNCELARLAEQRGLIVHGMWEPAGRGRFTLRYFEQKTALTQYENTVTLRTIREIRSDSFLLAKRVHEFTSGKDGDYQGSRAFLEIAAPIIPVD